MILHILTTKTHPSMKLAASHPPFNASGLRSRKTAPPCNGCKVNRHPPAVHRSRKYSREQGLSVTSPPGSRGEGRLKPAGKPFSAGG